MNSILSSATPWPTQKGWEWYDSQPWRCGFNYLPASAISYTEMFMDYGFDPIEIDNELALAQSIGFNAIRVVLPYIVWEAEPELFKARFDTFLQICSQRDLAVMPCLFDDCAFGEITDPTFGPQPDVVPGWYASGWTPSPGHGMVRDTGRWPQLERYVKDIVATYADDARVWIWDVYNEPAGVLGDISIELMEKVFVWARESRPSQPLTVAEYDFNVALNAVIKRNTDISTFHCYEATEETLRRIRRLREDGRPIICTEWLNRPIGSRVSDILPLFNAEKIGCLHWGLVNGRSQTHLCWGHRPGDAGNDSWQHDLFHSDLTPYAVDEITSFVQQSRHSQG